MQVHGTGVMCASWLCVWGGACECNLCKSMVGVLTCECGMVLTCECKFMIWVLHVCVS